MAGSSNSAGLSFAFSSQVVLVPFLTLSSWPSFVGISIVVSILCISERFLACLLETKHQNSVLASSMRASFIRTALFASVTSLRLLYMLVSMTCHAGLLAIIIISLSAGQLLVESGVFSAKLPNASSNLKDSGRYDPIPLYSTSQFRPEEDVESAPPSWSLGTWDGTRDKPRQARPGSKEFSPLSHQTLRDTHAGSSQATIVQPGSPIFHRRHSSITSVRPLRGSNSHLPGRSTPPGGIARKPLFHIGSGDENQTTSESE